VRIGLAIALFGSSLWAAPAVAQDDYKPSDLLKEENSLRPPAEIEGRSNVAMEYFRVWDSVSRNERILIEEAAAEVHTDAERKLGPRQREVCAQYRGYIDALIAAANAPDCQWGVRYDAGWMCLLPHLGPLRHSTRVIRMDVCRCIDDKSYTAAAERIAAIIRMSNQMRDDEIIISSLVGAAICGVGLSLTEQMLKDSQLSPASARVILAAIKSVESNDLFGSARALQRERQISVDWMRDHYQGEHAGWRFMEEVGGLAAPSGGDFFNTFVYPMDGQRLGTEFDRLNKYFDAAAAAWKKPDNTILLSELSTQVWEGQFGIVARVMAPSMERIARSMNKSRADIGRVRGKLEAIVRANEAPSPVDGAK
jgi:hypothetical protein